MDSRKRFLWLLAALVFAVALTVYMLSEFVIHPQSTMMTLGGDAGKNYLSYFYQCFYGKGTWYQGMNYPYGEHIIYADGQALLTIPISYLNQVVHFKKTDVLTIMNVFIAVSFVLGIVYVYKTLIYFKVAPWASIVFSGLIMTLSPQVLRLESHFALANMCFLPMLFYWYVRYYDNGGIKYIVYSFILGGLMSFQHPYFGGILLVWNALYIAGYLLLQKISLQAKMKHLLPPVLCVVGIFILVKSFMFFTDPVADRPVYPYGALQTVTRPAIIFTSGFSPFWKFVGKQINYEFHTDGEGYVYLGIAVGVILFISLFLGIKRLLKSRKAGVKAPEQPFPAIWLFVALGSLVLALGIPFVWNMEWLFEYMSVLRQFRALGRFSWIFYYIISIYAAVVLYGWYANAISEQKVVRAWCILVIPMLVWASESKAYIKVTRHQSLSGYYNFITLFSGYQETWEDFLAKKHLTGSDFQAVILLPFIHIGSEKIWVHENDSWLVTLGAEPALQLHLPIVNVMMSRTSLSQTQKQVRLAAGPFADKPLLRDMKNHKPFLVLHFEEDSLDADQKYIIDNSDYLGHFSQCNIYSCNPDRLVASDKHYADSAMQVARHMSAGDTCIYAKGSWFVNHFDTGSSARKLFGTGAARPIKADDKTYIAQIRVTPAYGQQWYELSLWVLLQAQDYRSPEFNVEALDSAGHVLMSENRSTKESVDNSGMWFRASWYYKLPAHTTMVRCRLLPYQFPCYFAMDELMLRPAESLIISKGVDGKVMANNHLLQGAL